MQFSVLSLDLIKYISYFLMAKEINILRSLSKSFLKIRKDEKFIEDNPEKYLYFRSVYKFRHIGILYEEKRCLSCGAIFSSRKKLEEHISRLQHRIEKMKLHVFSINYSLCISSTVSFYLVSMEDINCAQNKCTCQSKNYLNLCLLSTRRRSKKYKLQTNYGIFIFNTQNYIKYIMGTNGIYKLKSCDVGNPDIIVTKKHYWLKSTLPFSSCVIPITQIILTSSNVF